MASQRVFDKLVNKSLRRLCELGGNTWPSVSNDVIAIVTNSSCKGRVDDQFVSGHWQCSTSFYRTVSTSFLRRVRPRLRECVLQAIMERAEIGMQIAAVLCEGL